MIELDLILSFSTRRLQLIMMYLNVNYNVCLINLIKMHCFDFNFNKNENQQILSKIFVLLNVLDLTERTGKNSKLK